MFARAELRTSGFKPELLVIPLNPVRSEVSVVCVFHYVFCLQMCMWAVAQFALCVFPVCTPHVLYVCLMHFASLASFGDGYPY